jgi:hypothetical protein
MARHLLRSNNPDADTSVGAAMRPPQLELWGLAILDFVLKQPKRPRIVVHLGDAANISCRGEFARFKDLMNLNLTDQHGGVWLMSPGNHDSLVMGNWAYKGESPPPEGTEPNPWNRECSLMESSGAMDKAILLQDYLDAKGWKQIEEADMKTSKADDRFRCTDVATSSKDGIKARECRGDNPLARYAWFLVQQIDIDLHTQLLVLDTTQYATVPSGARGLWNPGGVRGGILRVQLEEAKALLTKDKALILAGHFPIESLDSGSGIDCSSS